LSSLLALTVLATPQADEPRGSFDSVVPHLPGGYGPGRVSIRVHAVQLPETISAALVGDLVARTGVPITETQGVRIEITLPDDVRFASMQARVVDGLILEPQERSLLGRVGSALVSLLRLLLVGRMISAADELAIPGAAWAAALGAPDADEELVRLSTSETLSADRDASAFSEHGSRIVYRSMLALSAWTELVDIRLCCHDRVSGKPVAFFIPRVPLHADPATPKGPSPNPQLVHSSRH
jgi:hypothetical protein